MSKPLTPTQIKAVVEKLRAEASAAWNAKVMANSEANAAKFEATKAKLKKQVIAHITKGTLTKADRCWLMSKCNGYNLVLTPYENKLREQSLFYLNKKAIEAADDSRPSLHYPSRSGDNHPINTLVRELQFKLTMAGADGYEAVMASARADIKELIAGMK
jgi:hypothetical protein